MIKTPFSRIVAGTMTWGVWGKNCSENEMIDLMHIYLENGITTFDHADIYGDYTTESTFGNAFRESKIGREKIQLISKCGIQLPSEARKNSLKHYDYSKIYIVNSVEQSLKNLQTDYLDLLLLHRPSPLMQVDEIAEAIFSLEKEGKILDFGVSNFNNLQCELVATKTKINYNQIQFSLTHHEPMSDGSLDYMKIQQITPMAWNPLGAVFKGNDAQSQRIMKTATPLAVKYNVTVAILLLGWILRHPSGILPVCGTTDKNRITQLMKATQIELELKDWFALWTASKGEEVD
jgi:predicted oxidoreductase